jgi:hypothetical protein
MEQPTQTSSQSMTMCTRGGTTTNGKVLTNILSIGSIGSMLRDKEDANLRRSHLLESKPLTTLMMHTLVRLS